MEYFNATLFRLRFHGLKKVSEEVLGNYKKDGYVYLPVEISDIEALSEFRHKQKHKYLCYFDPHPFDTKTLERLLSNPSYSLMKIVEKSTGELVGYFFLRCFFIGKAFHGLIVDQDHTNRGLGTSMWEISMEICNKMGLRMFATVSEKNIPSLTSAGNATDVKISEKLDNDYYLIECSPKAVK